MSRCKKENYQLNQSCIQNPVKNPGEHPFHTSTFKKRNSDEIYHIHKPRYCNSKKTVYLIEHNQCCEQYTGSSKTKFRYKANNYESTYRKFKEKSKFPKNFEKALKQKKFSTKTFAQMTIMVFKIR